MIPTASAGFRYHNSYSPESVYGHVLRLVERFAPPVGVVLDLGCGQAPVAEPLEEWGFRYVGAELDPEAIGLVRDRGFECHPLDLNQGPSLDGALRAIAGGRPISAVLLIDAIEHIPRMRDALDAIAGFARSLDPPPILVTSIPHVAHFDIASKLLLGRWDTSPIGLLDETHFHLFTEQRVRQELARVGFHELGRDDFSYPFSDQHHPVDHPVLAAGTPLHLLLRTLRNLPDSSGDVIQFARAFGIGSPADPPIPEADPTPVVSFVLAPPNEPEGAHGPVRESWAEDAEIILVGGPDWSGVADYGKHVLGERDDLGSRFDLGVRHARGEYVVLVTDPSQCLPDWVTALRNAPRMGHLIRARLRDDARTASVSAEADQLVHVGLPASLPWDLSHFAIPRPAFAALGLGFERCQTPASRVALILKAAEFCGVSVAPFAKLPGERSEAPSTVAEGASEFLHAHRGVPFMLANDAALRLFQTGSLGDRDAVSTASPLEAKVGDLQREIDDLRRSHSWRFTRPARIVGGLARRAFGSR